MESILPIKDKDGNLIGIVYADIKRRSKVFYSVKEMDMDDIASVLPEQNG